MVDDQNFKKGVDIKKIEDQLSRGSLFFVFINQNLCHIFCSCSYFSRYYTKREMERVKLMTALFFFNAMT